MDLGEGNESTRSGIREQLQSRFKTSGMDEAIKKLVEEICSSKDDPLATNAEEVISAIYKRGLMDTVLKQVDQFHSTEESSKKFTFTPEKDEDETESENNNHHEGRRYYLKVEILGGKAFMDHLSHKEDSSCKQKLILHVFYKSQRFKTLPVDCQCNPRFRHEFMIDIGNFANGSVAELLVEKEPVLRILVVREDLNLLDLEASCRATVVTSYTTHDWRSALLTDSGSETFSLPLMGIGSESNIPIGLLSMKITILPCLNALVSEKTFLTQMYSEKSCKEESQRKIISAGKVWMKEYLNIRPTLALRNVQLFAFDERMVSRPVTSFIQHLANVDRIFMTPFQAAWFVALLSHKQESNNSKSNENTFWQSIETTLISKSGLVEDLAVLLCSLLIGFGLNAFVACGKGKSSRRNIFWVVSFDDNFRPAFWNPSTGKYYSKVIPTENINPSDLPEEMLSKIKEMKLDAESQPFQSISCVFNNEALYVNIQETESISILLDWNINNPQKWKCFTVKTPSQFSPSLLAPTINSTLLSSTIELELEQFITEKRTEKGLPTRWDNFSSKLMGQKLATFELQASTGAKHLENFFETAIMKSIPAGYDFKGYHHHASYDNPRRLFYSCLKDPSCQEVLFCRGEDVQLSLRVSVFPHPENVISVRLMIACKYIETS